MRYKPPKIKLKETLRDTEPNFCIQLNMFFFYAQDVQYFSFMDKFSEYDSIWKPFLHSFPKKLK